MARKKKVVRRAKSTVLHIGEIGALATPVIGTIFATSSRYTTSPWTYATKHKNMEAAQTSAVQNIKEHWWKMVLVAAGFAFGGKIGRKVVRPQGVKGMKVGF